MGAVTVDGREYVIPRPTVGTIIMVSELVSTLPEPFEVNSKTFLADVMAIGKDTRVLGRIVAVLLLGAERVLSEECKGSRRGAWWKFWRRGRNAVDELSDAVLRTMSPTEVSAVVGRVIETLQIGHFFGLTTSLKTQNILASTRGGVVTSPTTASGH